MQYIGCLKYNWDANKHIVVHLKSLTISLALKDFAFAFSYV